MLSRPGSRRIRLTWIFLLSTDSTITTADYYLGRFYIDWIAEGAYIDVSFEVLFVDMPVLPVGSYYIGWIVDRLNDVAESNEANNTACITTKWLEVSTLAAAFVPLNMDAGDSPVSRRMSKTYPQP